MEEHVFNLYPVTNQNESAVFVPAGRCRGGYGIRV